MRCGRGSAAVRLRFGCSRPIKTANDRKKKITGSLRCLPVISEFEARQVTESCYGVEVAYIKGRYGMNAKLLIIWLNICQNIANTLNVQGYEQTAIVYRN